MKPHSNTETYVKLEVPTNQKTLKNNGLRNWRFIKVNPLFPHISLALILKSGFKLHTSKCLCSLGISLCLSFSPLGKGKLIWNLWLSFISIICSTCSLNCRFKHLFNGHRKWCQWYAENQTFGLNICVFHQPLQSLNVKFHIGHESLKACSYA